jgi:hypothetical protein
VQVSQRSAALLWPCAPLSFHRYLLRNCVESEKVGVKLRRVSLSISKCERVSQRMRAGEKTYHNTNASYPVPLCKNPSFVLVSVLVATFFSRKGYLFLIWRVFPKNGVIKSHCGQTRM